jgi:uncharacterized protein YbjT (DUF2867 family)
VALAAPRSGIVEIAGPERAPFNEMVARYLKAVVDPREVVSDPKARYFGASRFGCSRPREPARLGRPTALLMVAYLKLDGNVRDCADK